MTDPFDTGPSAANRTHRPGSPELIGCRHYLDRPRDFDAVYDLDRVAVRFAQSNPFSAAGFIDAFDIQRTG